MKRVGGLRQQGVGGAAPVGGATLLQLEEHRGNTVGGAGLLMLAMGPVDRT